MVDIGEVEETSTMPIVAPAMSSQNETRHDDMDHDPLVANGHVGSIGSVDASIAASGAGGPHDAVSASAVAAAAAVAANNHPARTERDGRIDDVISLLAEFMPSDAQSNWGPYLPGFMSLRLLLLRQTRSPQEEEIVRTMMDSYSSYTSGGRQRADIAVMLARDFIFINQQHQQQPPFLSLDGGAMAAASSQNNNNNAAGLSLFGLPSTNSSLQNSPALAPIPVPGSNDSMSVVSN